VFAQSWNAIENWFLKSWKVWKLVIFIYGMACNAVQSRYYEPRRRLVAQVSWLGLLTLRQPPGTLYAVLLGLTIEAEAGMTIYGQC